MTGRDVITASLRLIGAVAPGESIAASEATEGLVTLNRMISSWSTESLLIYAKVREEFTLTPNQQSYTMGSGANFNATRPLRIEAAAIELQTTTPVTEIPIRILTVHEWAEIQTKELSSEIPTDLYPEGTYPNETLNLYPKPSAAEKLVLYSWKPLTAVTLDADLSFPPGYEEALIYNLAARLSPEYGKPLGAEVNAIAGESKANIKRMNHRPRFLKADEALTGSHYNILTGGYR